MLGLHVLSLTGEIANRSRGESSHYSLREKTGVEYMRESPRKEKVINSNENAPCVRTTLKNI